MKKPTPMKRLKQQMSDIHDFFMSVRNPSLNFYECNGHEKRRHEYNLYWLPRESKGVLSDYIKVYCLEKVVNYEKVSYGISFVFNYINGVEMFLVQIKDERGSFTSSDIMNFDQFRLRLNALVREAKSSDTTKKMKRDNYDDHVNLVRRIFEFKEGVNSFHELIEKRDSMRDEAIDKAVALVLSQIDSELTATERGILEFDDAKIAVSDVNSKIRKSVRATRVNKEINELEARLAELKIERNAHEKKKGLELGLPELERKRDACRSNISKQKYDLKKATRVILRDLNDDMAKNVRERLIEHSDLFEDDVPKEYW